MLRASAAAMLVASGWAVPAMAQSVEQLPEKVEAPTRAPDDPRRPIITDEEFEGTIPNLDDAPMESIEEWQKQQDAAEKKEKDRTEQDPNLPAFQDGDVSELLPDPPATDPLLDEPLPSIETFDAEPPPAPTEEDDSSTRKVRYNYLLMGLDDASGEYTEAFSAVMARFDELSVLEDGDGQADNGAMVAARTREDRKLLVDILSGEGFFDATVNSSFLPPGAPGAPIAITLTAAPGKRYTLGNIVFTAPPTVPDDLISRNFVPKTGEPIIAERILASEANIAVKLPQNGYPFTKIGDRDILLDGETGVGDYTLPVDPGARSYFGSIITEENAVFDAKHVEMLRRYQKGELYDSRKLDDLRAALVATSLLSTVSVEAIPSEEVAPDGTAYADLLVRMEKGPARTLSASGGYSTGQGLRAEGSWTHRNMFPPEGALSLRAVLGTLEQGIGVGFTRSNAGKRDRTVDLSLSAFHSNYDAFEAYTGKLSGRISRASTPIWQKKYTYAYGFELIGTNEEDYDFGVGARTRNTYYVLALPGQVGFDTSDNLLDPTKGFRVNLSLSPETSLGSGAQFYARTVVEGIAYYPVGENMVLAGRARAGSIAGVSRNSLAPSRRFYGGGGGSVRGFGYQELGPKDPNDDPIGGRSLVEAAAEVRYRFGDFGAVGFIDAGNVFESTMPKFDDWRFGVGVGARYYTNFGPIRFDIATPINRQPGESLVSVYVSIGQAF